MADNRKKIVLFLVEGINDQTALAIALSKLISKPSVRVEITDGDITSDYNAHTQNIRRKIGDIVNRFKGRVYKPSDFLEVVHLIDLDGAFVADECIHPFYSDRPVYEDDAIKCKDVQSIIARNHHKQDLIHMLITLPTICSIPYSLYFFSANLDHVLFDSPNLTREEKSNKADEAQRRFNEHPDELLTILRQTGIFLSDDYGESWKLITAGTESLHRHSNFNIFFGCKPKNSTVL